MTQLPAFAMERWQSTYENQVAFNLSESGVHPVTLDELLALSGGSIADTRIGYGQSNGTEELRSHIAALYDGAHIDDIVVTNGSAEANFAALWHLVEPGADVVIIMPTYMQASGIVAAQGGNLREVWLREAAGWQPDPAEIEAAVSARTKLIVVTNPGNPTGSILGAEARAAIERAADRTGAWILADEVYAGAELNGVHTPSFWRPGARVVATGSLSKAYGLAGLRLGWAIAPRALADAIWARKDYTTISPGQLTDRLATLALEPDTRARLIRRTQVYIREGLAVLEPWLEQAGIFRYTRPAAGAILFARYNLAINSSDLADRLRSAHSLLIVPGDHFRLDYYLRFGFGLPAPDLSRALERFADCLTRVAAATG